MKENVTAEVFPTLRNISLSRRTFVACAAIAAAQAALVSAGCAPEVHRGRDLPRPRRLPRGRIRRPRPARRAR